MLTNVLLLNLHGGYTDVQCIVTFTLYIVYTFFDMDGVLHNSKKREKN